MSAQTIQQTIQHLQASRKEMEKMIQHEQDIAMRLAKHSVDFERRAMIFLSIMMFANLVSFALMSWMYVCDVGSVREANIILPLLFSIMLGCMIRDVIGHWKKAKDNLYLTYLQG